METFFSDSFVSSLKKYASIKKAIQKKVDMIIENPVAVGEPLKGTFRGFYSCPVKKRFLIIYLYCRICRKKRDDEIVLCVGCKDTSDDTIKFIALGPHDESYRR